MSSSANQYFQNSQYYPHHYTPMVNVPTTNRLPSHGELVASVELLIAHVTQFANRMDRIESRINDWVNLGLAERMMIAETNIDNIKKCNNEHDTKIAATNIELNYVFDSIKYTNERIVDNEKVIDRISDILTEHESKLRHAKQRSRDNATKCAEIGILRRRISKVEDFTSDFVECFDTPSQLRGMVTQMSAQAEDCDRTLTYMVRYGCGGGCVVESLPRADDYEEEDRLEASKNVEEYFANYGEEGEVEEVEVGEEGEVEEEDKVLEEDADEEEEEEDEFEKL